MDITSGFAGREQAIVDLFAAAFTASEGEGEGALIGGLVRDLLAATPPDDIRVWCAEAAGRVIGAAVFTRLTFANDPHTVAILSPMAVAPDRQGQGVGQAVLTHALSALRSDGFEIAVTYGDPNYYRRVGFVPIGADRIPPPLALSQPHGWLAQSLTASDLPVLRGPSACVPALDRADLW